MIRVFAAGEDRHRLEDDAGTHVGWIRGRALSFGGMRSEAEAMAAVVTAWRPFNAALRRRYFGWPHHDVALDQLRTVHDGAYEWVTDGRRPLARLHRPPADRIGGEISLEFVLPSYASEGVVISVAQAIANALQPYLAGGEYSMPIPLADFLPGLGTVRVDPTTLPAGPFFGYDHEGELVSSIYMIPLKDLNARTAFSDLEVARERVDHVDIVFNAGHPGVAEPHYHVIVWYVSPQVAAVLTK